MYEMHYAYSFKRRKHEKNVYKNGMQILWQLEENNKK